MSMKIVFVVGRAGHGKTTYIADRFPDLDDENVFDVFQYQDPLAYPKNIDDMLPVFLSFILLEYDLTKALLRAKETQYIMSDIGKEKADFLFVVEGTYLKKARRMSLLQTIKNHAPDAEIECVWIQPKSQTESDKALWESIIELPENDEGYSSLKFVVFSKTPSTETLAIAKRRRSIDRISQSDMLKYKEFGVL